MAISVIKTDGKYLYTPYIDENIIIPLKSNEEIDIKVFLLKNVTKEDEVLGKVIIYINNQQIYSKDVMKYL